jgi:hypothetical protein
VSGEVPAGDVLVEACTRGTEPTGRDSIEVTRDAVREVLGTGLFSSRGGYRLGWAHQSYAEFLAARHLAQRQLPQMQLRGLFAVVEAPGEWDVSLIDTAYHLSRW